MCSCPPAGENPEDIVYDATRYALARLMTICQHYLGTGREAYIARLCMVAYLPLTRLFDAHSPTKLKSMHEPDGSRVLDIDRCAKLVDIDEVLCFNTMPNMCDMMWANDYWYETKRFQENTLRHAYHHMFCKALPQRCKFRSMLPICVEYGVQHGQFADFMYAVVRCSLMGLSETASAPCSFESIRRLDAIFAPAEDLDSGRRCEFVCRFSHVMFHAVKEYVCTTVRHISGLSDMLDLTYRWWIFESRIHDTMKQIRMQISDEFNSVVHGAPLLEPAMLLPSEIPKLGIDEMANVTTDSEMNDLILQGYIGDAYSSRPLEFWSRANKSMIVKTGGGQLISCGTTTDGSIHTSFEAAMGPVEDTACRLNGAQEKNMFQMCREPAHVIIRLALQRRIKPTASLEQRIPRYEPFDMHTAEERMQKYYGISPATAHCVVMGLHEYRATGYVCADFFDTLNSPSLSQEDADALSVYCDDIDISALFHFVPLPDELRQEQLQAIRRKYCIQEDDSDETELGNLAEVYFCLTCMSTKAFVVESPEDGLIACGSVGIPHVVYNNSTHQLECRQCTDKSKMFRFSLAGIMARIGKRLHIICSECASICLMDITSYSGNSYICATCVQNAITKRQREFDQTDVCAMEHCKTKLPRDASCHTMLVIDDSKNNEPHVVGYCYTHRMMATMVHRTTNILSEINSAVVELIKEKMAPRRGAMKKTDVTRFAIAAHKHVAYSLFGGRR